MFLNSLDRTLNERCFIFLIYLFIHSFLAVLGLHCCMGLSLAVVSGGYSRVVVRQLFTSVASLVAEPSSGVCGLRSGGTGMGSGVVWFLDFRAQAQ